MSLHRLLPLYERARAALDPLVLCTVVRTAGSTYAKPGAFMLIASDGEYAGLLSGGCLEGDLREHAREVAASGQARIVSYDMRTTHDDLFGLGSGCEGAMDILLTRVAGDDGWQPLATLADHWRRGEPCRVGFVVAGGDAVLPLGRTVLPAGTTGGSSDALANVLATASANRVTTLDSPAVEVFVAEVAPAPHLLLAGGGPDARPVATLAAFLGWRVTVADHRPTYLAPARFPDGARLVETRADDVATAVNLAEVSAAIIMSHHLDSDLHYLRALANSAVPYVGLLGPAARRERLLADLGAADAARIRARLHAPVGLDLGGRSPESIALSIIGEAHAALAGRDGRPFSEVADAPAMHPTHDPARNPDPGPARGR